MFNLQVYRSVLLASKGSRKRRNSGGSETSRKRRNSGGSETSKDDSGSNSPIPSEGSKEEGNTEKDEKGKWFRSLLLFFHSDFFSFNVCVYVFCLTFFQILVDWGDNCKFALNSHKTSVFEVEVKLLSLKESRIKFIFNLPLMFYCQSLHLFVFFF